MRGEENLIGISTAYNITKSKSWDELIKELTHLGFKNIELNPEIPEIWMKDIEKSLEEKDIKIVALHNFCPKIEPLPEGRTPMSAYNFASENEEERNMAIKMTKRTIDYAKKLNAETVIVHAGDMCLEVKGRYLHKLAIEYGTDSLLFKQLREKLLEERKKKIKKYYENLKRTLYEILEYAVMNDITIALENRLYADEIPLSEDLEFIFTDYNTSHLKYWHDTGHAEILTKMGVEDSPLSYIEKSNNHLCGFHLHDVKKLYDHLAIGCGEINFKIYKPFLKGHLIMEPHQKAKSQEVKNTIQFLNDLLKN